MDLVPSICMRLTCGPLAIGLFHFFSLNNLDEHERLSNLLQPLGNFDETTKTKDSILGVPICRLGVGLTAYWLPIRSDISINQLPVLLKKCSSPKQALILPMEAVNRVSGDLPSVSGDISLLYLCTLSSLHPCFSLKDFIGIEYRQCLDIQLTAPQLLHVQVNPEVLMARSALTLMASSSNGVEVGHVEGSSEKDPRKSRGSGNSGKSHLALVQGRLFFRDGIFLFIWATYFHIVSFQPSHLRVALLLSRQLIHLQLFPTI